MGNATSISDDNLLTPPADYKTPSFPSLYNPTIELDSDSSEGVKYLYYSIDIYRFSLYWTLLIYVPMYALCGLHSLVVHAVTKRRISRFTLLAPLIFVVVGMIFGVLNSAIIGYSLAAVYSVGLFRMSTWVPFLWAVIISLVTIIGSYSTIITIL